MSLSSGLSPLLAVPGLIYESLVRTRNTLYSKRLLLQRRLPRPVCSVGNLTLGGTGKTPLVIHVAEFLLRLGAVPALLVSQAIRSSRAALKLRRSQRIGISW